MMLQGRADDATGRPAGNLDAGASCLLGITSLGSPCRSSWCTCRGRLIRIRSCLAFLYVEFVF